MYTFEIFTEKYNKSISRCEVFVVNNVVCYTDFHYNFGENFMGKVPLE